MPTNRLEAFSDGVIAILITIMVLELKVPHGDDGGTDFAALVPLIPVFLSYVLSFVYVGIYWNNHHHMLHTLESVSGPILWANLHLLFWLSLIPFATGWMDESYYTPASTALYGGVLLMAALAYAMLQAMIIRVQGAQSVLRKAVRGDWKGKASVALYAAGIIAALRWPPVALALYVLVALFWLIPDRRIERTIQALRSP